MSNIMIVIELTFLFLIDLYLMFLIYHFRNENSKRLIDCMRDISNWMNEQEQINIEISAALKLLEKNKEDKNEL